MPAKGTVPGAFDLLLVEDNPGDVRLVQEALREMGTPVRLSVATDGAEALDELNREGRPPPDLMLLDLNLPRVPGLDVLAQVKGDARLRRMPVVVFSSSGAPDDIDAAYAGKANCYVQKPQALDAYMDAVREIGTFWSERCVRSPTRPGANAP